MTPEELKAAIQNSDALREEIGLSKSEGTSLVVVRSKPPSGYKIKTPFGLCRILNCQEINGRYQTVFWATRDQVERYLKKALP